MNLLTLRRRDEMIETAEFIPTVTERRVQMLLYWRHRGSARLILPNYTPWRWHECDVFVITGAYYTVEYEIKLSVSDFRADQQKQLKHKRLRERQSHGFMPTRFVYVTPEDLVPETDIPAYAGLIYVTLVGDRGDLCERVVRNAPRLSTETVPDGIVTHMQRTAYYRFWNERSAFGNYVDRIEREAAADRPPCLATG